MNEERSLTVNRVIEIPPKRIYDAFLGPNELAIWLPPEGFSGEVHEFDVTDDGLLIEQGERFLTGLNRSLRSVRTGLCAVSGRRAAFSHDNVSIVTHSCSVYQQKSPQSQHGGCSE